MAWIQLRITVVVVPRASIKEIVACVRYEWILDTRCGNCIITVVVICWVLDILMFILLFDINHRY